MAHTCSVKEILKEVCDGVPPVLALISSVQNVPITSEGLLAVVKGEDDSRHAMAQTNAHLHRSTAHLRGALDFCNSVVGTL